MCGRAMDELSDMTQAYGSRAYAESLAEFGVPLYLEHCGGSLLKRAIPGTSDFDAMGCYPLFFCRDWSLLSKDLAALDDDLVSVSLVADPFGPHSEQCLKDCFDVVNPFKSHYIVDLECPLEKIGSRHHRKMAKKASKEIQVEVWEDSASFTEQWCALYQTLVLRHGMSGIRAFSREAFARQLNIPGIVVHVALCEGEIVGAQLFFIQDDVAHCHLGAVNDQGYKSGAFYALDHFSFAYFSGKARTLDLGGGAGLSATGQDGLSQYKNGWSTETLPVYFCGKIIQPDAYKALALPYEQKSSDYFPAYRAGEFG